MARGTRQMLTKYVPARPYKAQSDDRPVFTRNTFSNLRTSSSIHIIIN